MSSRLLQLVGCSPRSRRASAGRARPSARRGTARAASAAGRARSPAGASCRRRTSRRGCRAAPTARPSPAPAACARARPPSARRTARRGSAGSARRSGSRRASCPGTRGRCCGAPSSRSRTTSWPATRALAAVRSQQRAQHLDRRRLAGAVRAEEAERLAARDVEVDAAHRLDVAEALDEAADRDRRARSRGVLLVAAVGEHHGRARGGRRRAVCAPRRAARRCPSASSARAPMAISRDDLHDRARLVGDVAGHLLPRRRLLLAALRDEPAAGVGEVQQRAAAVAPRRARAPRPRAAAAPGRPSPRSGARRRRCAPRAPA